MGTNYYVKVRNEDALDADNFIGDRVYKEYADEDGLHIGKSSVGWFFALQVFPFHGIMDMSKVEMLIRNLLWKGVENVEAGPNGFFYDEYGNDVDVVQFFKDIRDRSGNVTQEDYEEESAKTPCSDDFGYSPEHGLLHHIPFQDSCCIGQHGTYPVSYFKCEFS